MTRCARAFSILELLVVISIIALLTAILLPALQSGRSAAQDLKCRANLRSVTTDFLMFADPSSGVNRGNSESLGLKLFRLDDFQESVYRISEFWSGPLNPSQPLTPNAQPLMCPSGPMQLERRSQVPCDSGAVGPRRNVSVGFNLRLRSKDTIINGQAFLTNAYLSDKILQFPDTPLLFDIDGTIADSRGLMPYYSAPPVPGTTGPSAFQDGRFWFPAARHRGRVNVGFVGGHVLSSGSPLDEPWWRWDYVPDDI